VYATCVTYLNYVIRVMVEKKIWSDRILASMCKDTKLAIKLLISCVEFIPFI